MFYKTSIEIVSSARN